MSKWLALLVILLATPAHAATVAMTGFDACDTAEVGAVGSGLSPQTTGVHTGRCGLTINLVTGTEGYAVQTFTASGTAQTRAYVKPSASVIGTGTRGMLGLGRASDEAYGCYVRYSASENLLELGFKDSTYQSLGSVSLKRGSWQSVNVLQTNGGGTTCASADCAVTCALYLDGNRVLRDTYTSIKAADYFSPDVAWLGARHTNSGKYSVLVDDWVTDDATTTAIGNGTVVPFWPDGSGTNVAWGRTGSGGNCTATDVDRWGCVDDFASGTAIHDDLNTALSTGTDGAKYDLTLSTPSIAATSTVAAVECFAIADEQTDGARTYLLNIFDGTSIIPGVTHNTTTTMSYGARKLAPTKQDASAWSTDLSGVQAQLEKTSAQTNRVTAVLCAADTRSPASIIAQNLQDWDGDGRITIAAFGDSVTHGTGLGVCQGDTSAGYIPPLYYGGTEGLSQCTQASNCYTCSGAKTLACSPVGSSCGAGGTCTDYGPCQNTGKYPTAVGTALQQSLGAATKILNCGIDGNSLGHMSYRWESLMTGIGMRTQRYCANEPGIACIPDNTTTTLYCIGGTNDGATCAVASACPSGTCAVPDRCKGGANDTVKCTVHTQCPSGLCVPPCGTSKQCLSDDCGLVSQWPSCTLSCESDTGVCSNNHATDCETDGDCSGSGCVGGSNPGAICTTGSQCPGGSCTAATCTDLPVPDYVLPMIGGNDLNLTMATGCNGYPAIAPCPPMSTVAAGVPTPGTTPTPGSYAVQRLSCDTDLDCGANWYSKLCLGGSNHNGTCPVDGASSACPGGGVCTAAGGANGICSDNLTKACHTTDAGTQCAGTCNTSLNPGISLPNRACWGGSCSVTTTQACATGGLCGQTCADGMCPRGEVCDTTAKFCASSCERVVCTTDADCGPGVIAARGVYDGSTTASTYGKCRLNNGDCVGGTNHGGTCFSNSSACPGGGTCVQHFKSGRCTGCGFPGTELVCSGDHVTSCTKPADCPLLCLGGTNANAYCTVASQCPSGTCSQSTCTEQNPRYQAARAVIGAPWWETLAQTLTTDLETAGARVIWMVYPPASYDPTFVPGWFSSRDSLQQTRAMILAGDLGPNAVDLYTTLLRADRVVTPKRCRFSNATLCATDEDCPHRALHCLAGTNANATCTVDSQCPLSTCATTTPCALYRSTMRAYEDVIHFNTLGASVAGTAVANYLQQLAPVCSTTTTTVCGACSSGVEAGVACTTSSECTGWDTIGSTIKCAASDALCPGGEHCTQERACSSTDCTNHSLCTQDLSVKCTTDADCGTTDDPLRCRGGANAGTSCTVDSQCPQSTCSANSVCRPEGWPTVNDG